eukprot:TRINITY_DN2769_c0_g2_i1.p1 TRINITY_DN2769_c0_g2~~TRINITY_DN2769_c0_g2_i1.p1  ORF type:complete len:157 (+),score=15.21 TRINITY_DN2769_c0_g2_i1:797-1267(+)
MQQNNQQQHHVTNEVKGDFAFLRSSLKIVFLYLAIAAFIARASNFYFSILIILTLTALSLGFNYIGFITNSYSKVFQALTVVSIVFILACDVISAEYHALSRGPNAWRPQLVVRGLGVSITSSRPTSAVSDFGPGEILSSHRNYGKSCLLRRCTRV